MPFPLIKILSRIPWYADPARILSPNEQLLALWLDILTLFMSVPVIIFLINYLNQPMFCLFVFLPIAFLQPRWAALRAWRFPRITPSLLATCLFLLICAIAISLPLGFSGIFAPNMDTPKHIIIFKDLMHNSWPVVHSDCRAMPLTCHDFLRYSLGFYLLPSLLAAWAPIVTINHWITATCSFYYGILLVVMWLLGRQENVSKLSAALIVLAFILFGDFGSLVNWLKIGNAALFMHNEWMFGTGEYDSAMTDFRWVPQHMIPAFYATLYFLISLRLRHFSVASFAFPALIIVAWSPFIFINFSLFAVLYWLATGAPILHKRTFWSEFSCLLLALLGIAVLIAYLTAGMEAIPRKLYMPPQYLPFMLTKLGPLITLAWLVRRQLAERWLVVLALILLFFIPCVYFGIFDDFMKRESMPFLLTLHLLILIACAKIANRSPVKWLVLAILAVCLFDGVTEILYTGHPAWKKDVANFDPGNHIYFLFPGNSKFNTKLFAQYYAPCRKAPWFLSCD